jgi:hypothetical protein
VLDAPLIDMRFEVVCSKSIPPHDMKYGLINFKSDAVDIAHLAGYWLASRIVLRILPSNSEVESLVSELRSEAAAVREFGVKGSRRVGLVLI